MAPKMLEIGDGTGERRGHTGPSEGLHGAGCGSVEGVVSSRGLAAVNLDQKLLRLIDDPSEPLSATERPVLLQHVAVAQFSGDERPLSEWQRLGADHQGLPHPSRPSEALELSTTLTSAEWHATKHIAQGEWLPGTTTSEYLEDVRTSVVDASAVLHLGKGSVNYGSGAARPASRVGVRTEMDGIRAKLKKAANLPGHAMLVVYDPSRRRLLSGYQLPSAKALGTVSAWTGHRSL